MLEHVIDYILQTPVRAGLVSQPLDYALSGVDIQSIPNRQTHRINVELQRGGGRGTSPSPYRISGIS